MNFADFQTARTSILRENPGVRDCAATNVYAALARHIPPSNVDPSVKVHRCHLASEWAQFFGFPVEASRRALISSGVRDSLRLLFGHYAGGDFVLWLASDNYPVYGELARAAGLATREFPTLPEPSWPSESAARATELVLVTNPLKPLGRWLSDTDVQMLSAWLGVDSRRRVLLDSVYTFEAHFHPSTQRLLATGQAILLHSLTKGWLHPRLFGVTLVPEEDAPFLAPVFRGAPPPQASLARARELMAVAPALPQRIGRDLEVARKTLLADIPFEPMATLNAPGYFIPVAAEWQDVLRDHNILGIPATAFGSSEKEITVLTTLGLFA